MDRALPIPLRVFIKHLREQARSGSGAALLAVLLVFPSLMEVSAAGTVVGAAGSSSSAAWAWGHREVERILAERRATGTFTIVA